MPSTYDSLLRLELQATGENATTWGIKTNNNINLLAESVAGAATVNVAGSGDYTLSTANGVTDEARQATLVLTGLLTGDRNVIIPSSPKNYTIINQTTGAFAITLKQSGGTGVLIPRDGPTIAVATSTTCVDSIGATPYTKAFLAATSATLALTALGATSVGAALFVAADTSAARSAIGATTVGSALIVAVDTSAARTAIGATAVGSALIIAADATAGRSAISAAGSGAITASGLTQATSRLLGRTTAGTGAVEEISVGSNLTFTGGVLDAVAQTQKYVARSYAEYTSFSGITNALPVDNTVPLSTEGTQILSASITPSSATNRLRIRFQAFGTTYSSDPDGGPLDGAWAIFSGSTCLAAGRVAPVVAAGVSTAVVFVGEVEYVPGSTSAATITVRVGPHTTTTGMFLNGSSATRLFGGVARATLVVEEITP
jgi:hypothetical protein